MHVHVCMHMYYEYVCVRTCVYIMHMVQGTCVCVHVCILRTWYRVHVCAYVHTIHCFGAGKCNRDIHY